MDDKKKIKTAITAVLYYLLSEEEALASQQLQPDQYNQQTTDPEMWGFSGRQSQMMTRSLIQLRCFPGLKT